MSSNLGVPVEPQVYIGTWTNWSRGKILGATLTLTQVNGSFLIAFLALFVSFAGTSFFRLTCFALHHILSSRNPEDDVYHQRQAILRNSASGSNAFCSLSSLLWSHRHQTKQETHPFKRVAPLLLHAAVTIGAFAVAGIYSSRITALTGDEVLVHSPENLTGGNYSFEDEFTLYWPFMSTRINAFANYAQDCYSDGETKAAACKMFMKPQLPRQIDMNAACPFASSLCRTNTGNVRIDTGFLDSHHDLGFNAPESDRFSFRHVLQCAPLTTEGYVRHANYSSDSVSLPFSLYYYGPLNLGSNVTNYTHAQQTQTKELAGMEWSSFARYSILYVNSSYGKQSIISLTMSGRFMRPRSAQIQQMLGTPLKDLEAPTLM